MSFENQLQNSKKETDQFWEMSENRLQLMHNERQSQCLTEQLEEACSAGIKIYS